MTQPTSDRERTGHRTRRPATIVVDHRRPDAELGVLLQNLTAATDRHDRIVVWSVEPGVTARLARRHRRIEVLGRPAAWGGALTELTAGDGVVIVLDDGAVPVGTRWVRELIEAVTDGGADIATVATNGAPHPSSPLDCPGRDAGGDEIRRVAKACRSHGEPARPGHVHGPVAAFAPRVHVDPAATGLADLARAMGSAPAAAAPRVHELPRLYIHDRAGAPEVSVCLIVKDEAADLADCLTSVQPFADEIVVYDTGSSDDTVAVARSFGAVVIEGEWRNDFAWARNQALAAARGTWVLSIDADERLELDPHAARDLRGLLGDDPPVDRFVIDLYDLQGSVHAPVRATAGVPMSRLFRRRSCQWVGALHEQPDARPGTPTPRSVALPGLRFLHRGYLNEIVRDKNKWERNLNVVTAGVDTLPESDKECFDLGRSLRSVGDQQRAFTLFERAADIGTNVVITRSSLEFAALTLMEVGRSAEAEPLLDRLAGLEGGAGPARYLRGWVHANLGRWDEARLCFEGITDYDDNFTGFRAESVSLALSLAYRGLGRAEDGAEAAADAICRNALATEAWAVLLDCSSAGSPAERRVAEAVPAEHLVALFAQLQSFPLNARDRIADAIWQVHPGDRTVLAVASQLAVGLDTERAVVWSGRLRSNGLHALCPFRGTAADGALSLVERAERLAHALHRLDAEDLRDALEPVVAGLGDDELDGFLRRTLAEWPGAAGSVIVAGASTIERCGRIVVSLHDVGFAGEALAVLAHAAEADAAAVRAWLAPRTELVDALRAAATANGRTDLDPVLVDAA